MIKHFKIITVIATIIIYVLFSGITAHATSIPVGIDPGTMEFGEFCSWVMLLFGVHGDSNNPSYDYWNDSDFQEYLESGWSQTHLWETEGRTYDEMLRNCYLDYLNAKYKMTMSREVYEAFSEAIKNVFNTMQVKQVSFQGFATDGQYTKNSITHQLDSIYSSNFYLLNDTTNTSYNSWNNYWLSSGAQNITSAYYEVVNQTDQQIRINVYLTEYGTLNIENNRIYVNPGNNASIQKFDIISFYNNPTFIQFGQSRALQFNISNTLNELFRDDSVLGQVFIDAGIQSLIDADTNTIVSSYTDSTTADTIEVAIPSDVGRILTNVQDRVISVSQAITQAQAVVVDKADSQAVTEAQATVASDIPQFQTVGLSDLFPFCIPFDFIRFLNAFSDEPKTPEFDIQLPTGLKQNGNLQWYTQHVDFHQFDTIAMITRDIELVLFCVGLCLITRNIMIRS